MSGSWCNSQVPHRKQNVSQQVRLLVQWGDCNKGTASRGVGRVKEMNEGF